MHKPGADCSIGALSRGNSRGAKGAGHPYGSESKGQPEELDVGGRRPSSVGGTSRISSEVKVRFSERLGVQFPRPTRRSVGDHSPYADMPVESLSDKQLVLRNAHAVASPPPFAPEEEL